MLKAPFTDVLPESNAAVFYEDPDPWVAVGVERNMIRGPMMPQALKFYASLPDKWVWCRTSELLEIIKNSQNPIVHLKVDDRIAKIEPKLKEIQNIINNDSEPRPA